jgi:hypothetical protein
MLISSQKALRERIPAGARKKELHELLPVQMLCNKMMLLR